MKRSPSLVISCLLIPVDLTAQVWKLKGYQINGDGVVTRT
jgi:hypothetical protein